jgi:hypothetical protein
MKGQLDIQFQWIYVIIAGGTFLLLFFFAFKACTASNDDRVEVAGVRTAASLMSNAVWEPASPESVRNVTIHAQASCVAGTLTLTQGDSSAQIQRTPAFIPPLLSGRSSFIVRSFAYEADGIPGIGYGNILYIYDENTYYYTLDYPMPGSSATTREGFRDIDVPSGAKTLVLVTGSAESLQGLQVPRTTASVYAVAAKPDGTIDFYSRNGQTLERKGGATYAGDEMRLGAMIAATPGNYQCAKANFVQRARDIAKIYVARSTRLVDEGLPQACADQHALAIDILGRQMDDDQFIAALRDRRLMDGQMTLNALDCPVIA